MAEFLSISKYSLVNLIDALVTEFGGLVLIKDSVTEFGTNIREYYCKNNKKVILWQREDVFQISII